MLNKYLYLMLFLIFSVALCAQEDKNNVDALIKQLTQKNKQQKYLAINKLGEMGTDASEAIPHLIDILRGSDYLLKVVTAEALGKMGEKAVAPLVGLLNAQDQETREYVVDALKRIGNVAFSSILEHKADENVAVRVCVAQTLAIVGKNEVALPALIELLEDTSLDVKKAVITAMGKRKSPVVLPQLIAQLDNKDYSVQIVTIQAIGQIGRNAKQAISHLIPFLGKASTRDTVGIALMQIGEESITHLREALRHQDSEIRGGAAQAIGQLGTKASVALPDLVVALDDKEAFVRVSAAIGIRRMQMVTPGVVLALAKNLSDVERSVRQAAIETLATIAKDAKAAVPALIQNLGKERIDFKTQTLNILKALGKDAVDAIPALIKSLNSAPIYDREIVEVLDAIEPQWREKYQNQVPIIATEGISIDISCRNASPENHVNATIIVSNLGSMDLSGITVNVKVTPKEVKIISTEGAPTVSGNTIVWKMDSLTGEQIVKYNITIAYNADGQYFCAAEVNTDQGVKDKAECRSNTSFDEF